MFLELNRWPKDAVAAKDDSGQSATYGDIQELVHRMEDCALPRSVVFCLCRNSVGSLAGYLALESVGMVPLLLDAQLDAALLATLDAEYQPWAYWMPSTAVQAHEEDILLRYADYVLVRTGHDTSPLHDQLSLLLTTSGSTGSAKLVRHKQGNLESNAKAVAEVFGWNTAERALCALPMNYTMGLNVIHSHLYSGGCVLLAASNLMAPEFWDFAKAEEATSFCGVPYSYEIFRRLRFERRGLDSLTTLAEGGDRLSDAAFRWLAETCAATDRRFFATFGTTETSARMTYLPPELALEKTGSIGRAFPHGEAFLVDEEGNRVEGEGELCYRGPNVTMGYAQCRADLERGDDFQGEYHTGDLAQQDEDGCFYIVGRKKRFLKLFGLRVSMDEMERLIAEEFQCECACGGTDKRMVLYVVTDQDPELIRSFASQKTGIHQSAFAVELREAIPRNEYGKISYAALEEANAS